MRDEQPVQRRHEQPRKPRRAAPDEPRVERARPADSAPPPASAPSRAGSGASPAPRHTQDPTASADPVTAAQLRDAGPQTMAGLDPEAMGEGVGAHDGTPRAGDPTFSTSQGAGKDLDEDITEGRASKRDDIKPR
jgi:hypothetical protein